MTADAMLRLILTSRVYDVARDDAARRGAPAVAPDRQPGVPEARGSAADLHLQAARRHNRMAHLSADERRRAA